MYYPEHARARVCVLARAHVHARRACRATLTLNFNIIPGRRAAERYGNGLVERVKSIPAKFNKVYRQNITKCTKSYLSVHHLI